MRRRVWITAAGVVSPIGSGLERFADGCLAGRSGIGPVTLFDARTFPHRIAGEVRDADLSAIAARHPAAVRLRDRKVLLGLAAADEAVERSRLDPRGLAGERTAIVLGAGLDVMFLADIQGSPTDVPAAMARRMREILDDDGGWERLVPADGLTMLLAAQYGVRGPALTNVSACAAGAEAIGQAAQLVRDGVVDLALAGGSDSMVNPLGLGGFGLLGALSPRNDPPEEAIRPFDTARDGTVLGEGAVVLVLESAEHAAARDVEPLAEVLGYAATMDAHSVSEPQPSGAGAVRAMRLAVEDAGLRPEDVGYVSAHGTGTPKNDAVEAAAIHEVFGARARRIPVSALKSMTGHLLAAAGAIEALSCVVALQRRTVPPTINLTRPDPRCDLDCVPLRARAWEGDVALSNSFGFGGQNAVLVLGRVRSA